MNRLRTRLRRTPLSLPTATPRLEAREAEKLFARLFSTDDGQKVLGFLSSQTLLRQAGFEASDAALRFYEGQRALVTAILRLIERGRQPHNPNPEKETYI